MPVVRPGLFFQATPEVEAGLVYVDNVAFWASESVSSHPVKLLLLYLFFLLELGGVVEVASSKADAMPLVYLAQRERADADVVRSFLQLAATLPEA